MTKQTHASVATNRATVPAKARNGSVWSSGTALALSMSACYGILAAVVVLPIFGIQLAPDDTLWRTAIVAPAAVVVIVLAWGASRHASWLPTGLALAGCTLLAVLMFWHMNRLLEALAFTLLLSAVLVEHRHCARCGRTSHRQEDSHV